MKHIFETEDKLEALRIIKSLDMAILLWELQVNFPRKWKHSDKEPSGEEVLEALCEMLSEIDIENLIE